MESFYQIKWKLYIFGNRKQKVEMFYWKAWCDLIIAFCVMKQNAVEADDSENKVAA